MENPDNKDYVGFGSQADQLDSDGNSLGIKRRFLIPSPGMLRFVDRDIHNATNEYAETARILQQYQHSANEGKFDWYDIPLVAK